MSPIASPTTFEAVVLPVPPQTKFERERAAFRRLLPGLLATHRGQYVAIHGEQVVDSGPNEAEVALRVLRKVGNVAVYVHLVNDEKHRHDGADSSFPCQVSRITEMKTKMPTLTPNHVFD